MTTSSWGVSPNTARLCASLPRIIHLLTSFGQGPIPGRRTELGKNEFWHTAALSMRSAFCNSFHWDVIISPSKWLWKVTSSHKEVQGSVERGLSKQQTPLRDFMAIADIYSRVLTTAILAAFKFLCLFSLSPLCAHTLKMTTVNLAFPLNCLLANVNNWMVVRDNYN